MQFEVRGKAVIGFCLRQF